MTTLFAFLHHLLAFSLVSAVAVQFVLIRQDLTAAAVRRLQAADIVLGASAGLLLIVGLLRVVYFEKGAAYYFSSHAFVLKFSMFLALALFSIVPTIEFRRWAKAVKAGQAPEASARKLRTLRNIIHVELMGIVVILLAAAIMARGGWI